MPAKGFLLFEFELEFEWKLGWKGPILSIFSLYNLSIFVGSVCSVVTRFFLLLPVHEHICTYFIRYRIFSISNSTCSSLSYDQTDEIFNFSFPPISLLIFNSALLIAYAFGTYFFIKFASWSSYYILVHFGEFSNISLSHYNLLINCSSYFSYSTANLPSSSCRKYNKICYFFFYIMVLTY